MSLGRPSSAGSYPSSGGARSTGAALIPVGEGRPRSRSSDAESRDRRRSNAARAADRPLVPRENLRPSLPFFVVGALFLVLTLIEHASGTSINPTRPLLPLWVLFSAYTVMPAAGGIAIVLFGEYDVAGGPAEVGEIVRLPRTTLDRLIEQAQLGARTVKARGQGGPASGPSASTPAPAAPRSPLGRPGAPPVSVASVPQQGPESPVLGAGAIVPATTPTPEPTTVGAPLPEIPESVAVTPPLVPSPGPLPASPPTVPRPVSGPNRGTWRTTEELDQALRAYIAELKEATDTAPPSTAATAKPRPKVLDQR